MIHPDPSAMSCTLIFCLWQHLGCSPALLHFPEEYEVLQKTKKPLNKTLLIFKVMSTILTAGVSLLFTAQVICLFMYLWQAR